MAVNKFIGIGNLGRDPIMRFMPDGKAVANISICITEKYKDKQGEAKEVNEWVNIVFFGRLAEVVGQYLKKGQQVYVEGKLRTEKYQKDGQDKYITKIVGDTMQILSKVDKQEEVREREVPVQDLTELKEDIPF